MIEIASGLKGLICNINTDGAVVLLMKIVFWQT